MLVKTMVGTRYNIDGTVSPSGRHALPPAAVTRRVKK